jgi:hypothetical protein
MSLGGVMSKPARASENARAYLRQATRCAEYVSSSMALPLSQVVGRRVHVHMPTNYCLLNQQVLAITAVPSVDTCQRPINSAWQWCAQEYRAGQVPMPALMTLVNHDVAVTTPADAPQLCCPTAGQTVTLAHSAAQWQAPPPQVLVPQLRTGPRAAAAVAPPARASGVAQRRLQQAGPAGGQRFLKHSAHGVKLQAKAGATGPGRALESRATGALPGPARAREGAAGCSGSRQQRQRTGPAGCAPPHQAGQNSRRRHSPAASARRNGRDRRTAPAPHSTWHDTAEHHRLARGG